MVIANRKPKEVPDTEATLAMMRERAGSGKLVYMPFDVTEADKARDFVKRAEAELGEIHGLVSGKGERRGQ